MKRQSKLFTFVNYSPINPWYVYGTLTYAHRKEHELNILYPKSRYGIVCYHRTYFIIKYE